MRVNKYDIISLWRLAWLAGVLLWGPAVLPAQSTVTFESAAPSREVPEGTRFEVSFTLKNATAQRFIPPEFNGFRVTAGPSEMRGAGFINGKTYNHQSWSYELEAGMPGTYTIGPATVHTSAQTLRTQPLTIRVGKARTGRANTAPGSDDRLFLSAELDRETAWLGQQVHYQIKLYTQVSISDYDILDLPQFNGFFSQERRRFDTRTQFQTIRGKKYAVRVLHEIALFPQQTGELLIGPARARLGVEQPGSLSALLGAMPVVLQTQAVKLRVDPLPEPVPANFSGGVGRYKWQVSADKDTLTTDDALTLSVQIEGNGDTRSFANPRFELPAGLEGFEPKSRDEEEYETGEEFVHSRALEYVVLPRQPGDYSFVPELLIFDTDSSRYRTLRAEKAVTMHVTAGQFYGQNTAPQDTIAGPPPPAASPLDALWKNARSWLALPLLGGLAGIVLLTGLFLGWRRRKKHQPVRVVPEPDFVRPRPTLKAAREQFKAVYPLTQQADARLFYHDLLKALQHYVAAHLDTDAVLLTKEDMQAQLAARQVPEQTVAVLVQVWQRCEQAVFAGQASASGMLASWQQAEAAVQQLDATLK